MDNVTQLVIQSLEVRPGLDTGPRVAIGPTLIVSCHCESVSSFLWEFESLSYPGSPLKKVEFVQGAP